MDAIIRATQYAIPGQTWLSWHVSDLSMLPAWLARAAFLKMNCAKRDPLPDGAALISPKWRPLQCRTLREERDG
jgi:hypothetical protein